MRAATLPRAPGRSGSRGGPVSKPSTLASRDGCRPACLHAEPAQQRDQPRAPPPARLRPADRLRHRRGRVVVAATLGAHRRQARDHGHPGALGCTGRPHRGPAVQRDHQLAGGHRRGTGTAPSRSGGAGSASGAAWSAVSPWAPSAPAATACPSASARLRGPRLRPGAGHRPLGQLLQSGAVRPALNAALGGPASTTRSRPAGLPRNTPPSSPPSCTSASGISWSSAWSSGWSGASASGGVT